MTRGKVIKSRGFRGKAVTLVSLTAEREKSARTRANHDALAGSLNLFRIVKLV